MIPNYIYFEIYNENFVVTCLCGGLNDSQEIQKAIMHKTNHLDDILSKRKHSWGDEYIENEQPEIEIKKEIKNDGYKFFTNGIIRGKLHDKVIFIDSLHSHYLPRGYGNYMLCLFINYLKNYYKKYQTNPNFNIELISTNKENTAAYRIMGFYDRNSNTSNMKIDAEKFSKSCEDKFGFLGPIVFFESIDGELVTR